MMGINLPCSSFEELMLAKDSPRYPCDIWVRLCGRGKIDRAVFEACWQEMLAMHPLLRCRLTRGLMGHRWLDSKELPKIEWLSDSSLPHLPDGTEIVWPSPKAFNLEEGKLLFATVIERDDGEFELFMQIHHAVSDGLGILDFFEDLWTLYDKKRIGTEHKRLDRFYAVDCEHRLTTRNHFGLNASKIWKLIPKQMIGLAGVRQFLMRAPVPIVAHRLPETAPNKVVSTERELEDSLFQSIRDYAKHRQCTVNEVLAAAIFTGISRFRQRRSKERESDWIRMMIPMDMRTSDDRKNLSACNVVSSVFLDRQPSQILSFDNLVDSVNQEMNLIKTNKLAYMFLLSIKLRKLSKLGRHGPAMVKRCETSVVFTNVGRVFPRTKLKKNPRSIQSGQVELVDFSVLAPLNPFTVAAISFCEFASIPKLQLRYCNRVLSLDDAQTIMNLIVERLNEIQK